MHPLSSRSKSISLEHVPCVLYVSCLIGENIIAKGRYGQVEIIRYSREWDGKIAALFRDTIARTCSKDYTEGEVRAWISSSFSEAFSARWADSYTLLAVDGDALLGFGNADGSYIDCLYVDYSHQGKGIGGKLLAALEAHAEPPYSVYASITALPFFASKGYRAVRGNIAEREGERLCNYLLSKP